MFLNFILSALRKPDVEAKNSLPVPGRRSFSDDVGMCADCKEWCEVGASCCGRGVYFEGGFVADREVDDE